MMSGDVSSDDGSIETGDLGLGEGLRPGSLPKARRSLNVGISNLDNIDCENCLPQDIHCHDFVPPIQSKFLHFAKSHKSKVKKTNISSSYSDNMDTSINSKSPGESPECNDDTTVGEQFPTFAEIPYGTSLKQQKRLFAKDMSNIRQRCHSLDSSSKMFLTDPPSDQNHEQKSLSKEAIEMKLQEAEMEVEELKIELETYHKRLEAKYQAIAILKNQIIRIKEKDKRNKEYNKSLEKELNQLHYELDVKDTSIEDSQQIWAVRFDSICKDNASLMSSLQERSAELKSEKSKNMALMRERDELIALLDVQEQGRYARSKSVSSSDEEYSNYSSTELAVLGACKCRGSSPEPCGCAVAAANLRREIIKLNQNVDLHKKRRDEAYMTVDAYRTAFEEQLNQNKKLMLHISEIATAGPTKVEKAKAVVKRFIEMLNDEDFTRQMDQAKQEGQSISSDKPPNGVRPTDTLSMSEKDLVMALTEILNSRNEALANQKLAAKLLAERVKQLEEKATNQQQEVFHD